MDGNVSQVELFEEIVVKFISIGILIGSQGMSDSFKGIDNWTNEVISWIDFVLGSSGMMRSVVSSVNNRVPHASIIALHIDSCSKTEVLCLLVTLGHKIEDPQSLFNRLISVFGVLSLHPFGLHKLLFSVITIGIAIFDKLNGFLHDKIKVIRGTRVIIRVDIQSLQILND